MKTGNNRRTPQSRRSYKNFLYVARTRRSIRSFLPTYVSKLTLHFLLQLLRYAPSSMNARSVKVFIIRSSRVKERVAQHKNNWCPPEKKSYRADFLAHAPVLLIVCADIKKSHGRHVENGVIAATYLLLGAAALGLGSTFLTAYHPRKPAQARELKKILRLPSSRTPIAILPLGYSAKQVQRRRRARNAYRRRAS